MSGEIVRSDWGGGHEVVPSSDVGSLLDDSLRDPTVRRYNEELAAGLDVADRIEAALPPDEAAALNEIAAGLSQSTQGKLRAALAHPPLPGRVETWLNRLQQKLTLAEAAEIRAAVDRLTPSQTQAVLDGLVSSRYL